MLFSLNTYTGLQIKSGFNYVFFPSYLVANLQMKITWFWVKSQVNSVSIVADDVFGSGILAVSSSYQFLQSDTHNPNELADTSSLQIKKFLKAQIITLNENVPVYIERCDNFWEGHVGSNGSWYAHLVNLQVGIWGDDGSS